MSKERLEEHTHIAIKKDDYKKLKEQAERVDKLDSFKSSVEYTVDSETLELIINNQDSENVLKMSETYDEEIFLLLQQNKRYREALEFYANKKNYQKTTDWFSDIGYAESLVQKDAGKRARKALEGEE